MRITCPRRAFDHAHVTAALTDTILSYRRVDPGPHSDRYGIAVELDLTRIDQAQIREYT